MSLLSHVKKDIFKNKLFNNGDTVIVAISGGADSCALLDILSCIPELSLNLIAAHVNHCLRGSESDADEEYVRQLAMSYQIHFEFCRIDVADLAIQSRLSLEDAGRKVRHNYLEALRVRYDAHSIALAHHADDQAETVIMRLVRGAGSAGLSGMSFRNGNIVRPLLGITRSRIEDYLNHRNLDYRHDSSNNDKSFLRNRIRHDFMPLLRDLNPNVVKNINTTAAILHDEDDFIRKLAVENFIKSAVIEKSSITLSISWLKQQHLALRRMLIRTALEKLTGNLDNFTFKHIESILRLMEALRPNARLSLPPNISVVRSYDSLQFREAGKNQGCFIEKIIISETGKYYFNNYCLNLASADYCHDFKSFSPETVFIDLNKCPFPWILRTFKPGDRIQPLGMHGSKKLKDIFINKKVSILQRKQQPILCAGDKIIWVSGFCFSELAKLDQSTRTIIKADISINHESQEPE